MGEFIYGGYFPGEAKGGGVTGVKRMGIGKKATRLHQGNKLVEGDLGIAEGLKGGRLTAFEGLRPEEVLVFMSAIARGLSHIYPGNINILSGGLNDSLHKKMVEVNDKLINPDPDVVTNSCGGVSNEGIPPYHPWKFNSNFPAKGRVF